MLLMMRKDYDAISREVAQLVAKRVRRVADCVPGPATLIGAHHQRPNVAARFPPRG